MQHSKEPTPSIEQFALEYIKYDELINNHGEGNKEARIEAYKQLGRALHLEPWRVCCYETFFRQYYYNKIQKMVDTGASVSHEAGWLRLVEQKFNLIPRISLSPPACTPEAVVLCLCGAARRHATSLYARRMYRRVRGHLRGALSVPALHLLWVRVQRVSLKFVREASRLGDVQGVLSLPHSMVADLVLLHTDVDTHPIVAQNCGARETHALTRLWEMVQRWRVDELKELRENKEPGEEQRRWARVHADYLATQGRASLIVLRRRWLELKLCARERFLRYWRWSLSGDERDRGTYPTGDLPTDLHVAVIKKYPGLVLNPRPSWLDVVRSGQLLPDWPGENEPIGSPYFLENEEVNKHTETPQPSSKSDKHKKHSKKNSHKRNKSHKHDKKPCDNDNKADNCMKHDRDKSTTVEHGVKQGISKNDFCTINFEYKSLLPAGGSPPSPLSPWETSDDDSDGNTSDDEDLDTDEAWLKLRLIPEEPFPEIVSSCDNNCTKDEPPTIDLTEVLPSADEVTATIAQLEVLLSSAADRGRCVSPPPPRARPIALDLADIQRALLSALQKSAARRQRNGKQAHQSVNNHRHKISDASGNTVSERVQAKETNVPKQNNNVNQIETIRHHNISNTNIQQANETTRGTDVARTSQEASSNIQYTPNNNLQQKITPQGPQKAKPVDISEVLSRQPIVRLECMPATVIKRHQTSQQCLTNNVSETLPSTNTEREKDSAQQDNTPHNTTPFKFTKKQTSCIHSSVPNTYAIDQTPIITSDVTDAAAILMEVMNSSTKNKMEQLHASSSQIEHTTSVPVQNVITSQRPTQSLPISLNISRLPNLLLKQDSTTSASNKKASPEITQQISHSADNKLVSTQAYQAPVSSTLSKDIAHTNPSVQRETMERPQHCDVDRGEVTTYNNSLAYTTYYPNYTYPENIDTTSQNGKSAISQSANDPTCCKAVQFYDSPGFANGVAFVNQAEQSNQTSSISKIVNTIVPCSEVNVHPLSELARICAENITPPLQRPLVHERSTNTHSHTRDVVPEILMTFTYNDKTKANNIVEQSVKPITAPIKNTSAIQTKHTKPRRSGGILKTSTSSKYKSKNTSNKPDDMNSSQSTQTDDEDLSLYYPYVSLIEGQVANWRPDQVTSHGAPVVNKTANNNTPLHPDPRFYGISPQRTTLVHDPRIHRGTQAIIRPPLNKTTAPSIPVHGPEETNSRQYTPSTSGIPYVASDKQKIISGSNERSITSQSHESPGNVILQHREPVTQGRHMLPVRCNVVQQKILFNDGRQNKTTGPCNTLTRDPRIKSSTSVDVAPLQNKRTLNQSELNSMSASNTSKVVSKAGTSGTPSVAHTLQPSDKVNTQSNTTTSYDNVSVDKINKSYSTLTSNETPLQKKRDPDVTLKDYSDDEDDLPSPTTDQQTEIGASGYPYVVSSQTVNQYVNKKTSYFIFGKYKDKGNITQYASTKDESLKAYCPRSKSPKLETARNPYSIELAQKSKIQEKDSSLHLIDHRVRKNIESKYSEDLSQERNIVNEFDQRGNVSLPEKERHIPSDKTICEDVLFAQNETHKEVCDATPLADNHFSQTLSPKRKYNTSTEIPISENETSTQLPEMSSSIEDSYSREPPSLATTNMHSPKEASTATEAAAVEQHNEVPAALNTTSHAIPDTNVNTTLRAVPGKLMYRRLSDGVRKGVLSMVPSSSPGKNHIINVPEVGKKRLSLTDVDLIDSTTLDPVRLIPKPDSLEPKVQCSKKVSASCNKIAKRRVSCLPQKILHEVPVIPEINYERKPKIKPNLHNVSKNTNPIPTTSKIVPENHFQSCAAQQLDGTSSGLLKSRIKEVWLANHIAKQTKRRRRRAAPNTQTNISSPTSSTINVSNRNAKGFNSGKKKVVSQKCQWQPGGEDRYLLSERHDQAGPSTNGPSTTTEESVTTASEDCSRVGSLTQLVSKVSPKLGSPPARHNKALVDPQPVIITEHGNAQDPVYENTNTDSPNEPSMLPNHSEDFDQNHLAESEHCHNATPGQNNSNSETKTRATSATTWVNNNNNRTIPNYRRSLYGNKKGLTVRKNSDSSEAGAMAKSVSFDMNTDNTRQNEINNLSKDIPDLSDETEPPHRKRQATPKLLSPINIKIPNDSTAALPKNTPLVLNNKTPGLLKQLDFQNLDSNLSDINQAKKTDGKQIPADEHTSPDTPSVIASPKRRESVYVETRSDIQTDPTAHKTPYLQTTKPVSLKRRRSMCVGALKDCDEDPATLGSCSAPHKAKKLSKRVRRDSYYIETRKDVDEGSPPLETTNSSNNIMKIILKRRRSMYEHTHKDIETDPVTLGTPKAPDTEKTPAKRNRAKSCFIENRNEEVAASKTNTEKTPAKRTRGKCPLLKKAENERAGTKTHISASTIENMPAKRNRAKSCFIENRNEEVAASKTHMTLRNKEKMPAKRTRGKCPLLKKAENERAGTKTHISASTIEKTPAKRNRAKSCFIENRNEEVAASKTHMTLRNKEKTPAKRTRGKCPLLKKAENERAGTKTHISASTIEKMPAKRNRAKSCFTENRNEEVVASKKHMTLANIEKTAAKRSRHIEDPEETHDGTCQSSSRTTSTSRVSSVRDDTSDSDTDISSLELRASPALSPVQVLPASDMMAIDLHQTGVVQGSLSCIRGIVSIEPNDQNTINVVKTYSGTDRHDGRPRWQVRQITTVGSAELDILANLPPTASPMSDDTILQQNVYARLELKEIPLPEETAPSIALCDIPLPGERRTRLNRTTHSNDAAPSTSRHSSERHDTTRLPPETGPFTFNPSSPNPLLCVNPREKPLLIGGQYMIVTTYKIPWTTRSYKKLLMDGSLQPLCISTEQLGTQWGDNMPYNCACAVSCWWWCRALAAGRAHVALLSARAPPAPPRLAALRVLPRRRTYALHADVQRHVLQELVDQLNRLPRVYDEPEFCTLKSYVLGSD